MAAHVADLEKGSVSIMRRSSTPSPAPITPNGPKSDELESTAALKLFQRLIGLNTPSTLTQDGKGIGRVVPKTRFWRSHTDNIGLYHRAQAQRRSSHIAYLCTSIISHTLYMLQILLAATFTALSAYKDTHPVVLTVLGAANTVIAGCLAWQKGQGVPQRYRKATDQYQALVADIEETERSFLDPNSGCGADGVKLDPRVERTRLQKLFDTARADQQANEPDLYVSTGDARDKDLTRQLDNAKAELARVQKEVTAKVEALTAQLEGRVEVHVEDAIRSRVSA